MGWEDEKDSTSTDPERDTRELPASYPRTEAGYDLEMRNLASDDQIQRTRSPVDGLRRRLSRDPQVRMEREKEEERKRNRREIPVAVVEQRLSNLAQGCLCTSLFDCCDEANDRSGINDFPIPTCFRFNSKRCLSWAFRMFPPFPIYQFWKEEGTDRKWYMGTDALLTSGVTEKMLYLVRDKRSIEPTNPLNKVRTSRILMFLAVELIGFGATFAVTQVCPL